MSQDRAVADRSQEARDAGHGKDGHVHGSGARGAGHGGIFGERTELIFAALAGVSLLAGWLLSSRAPAAVSLSLYALTYVFGGVFTLLSRCSTKNASPTPRIRPAIRPNARFNILFGL